MKDINTFLRGVLGEDSEKELPEIYKQMQKLWKEFEKSPHLEPQDWAKDEGMDELFPLDSEQLIELFKKLPLKKHEILAMSSIEQTLYVTTLLTGIRLGYGLAKERKAV